MISIPYRYVNVAALCCYLVMLMAFVPAKKNRLINSFMVLLVAFMLWTGGSMFMRMQLFPGWVFWYEVSLLSLFTVPAILYVFICNFVGQKGSFLKWIWGIGTVIIMVLTHFEVFLARPELVFRPQGDAVFIYSMDWKIFIACAFFLAELVSVGMIIVRSYRSGDGSVSAMAFMLAGMGVLFVGNILSIMPNNIFPYDTLSGILNAVLLFFALYKKRMFKLTLLASPWPVMVASMLMVTALFANLIPAIEKMINRHFAVLSGNMTLVIAVIFLLLSGCCYILMRAIMDALFIREEQRQSDLLGEFSANISKSLKMDEVVRQFMKTVQEGLGESRMCVCLRDDKTGVYRTAYTASPLSARTLELSADHPCICWLKKHDACLIFKEFIKTVEYKSIWEEERRQLRDYSVGCMVPLKCDDGLIGVLMLPNKAKNASYTVNDISFLDTTRSIVSIAIQNASMYQRAYYEARIDYLTGLFNRKFFHERLEEEIARVKNDSLALVILNLDDFKLYNQLYGNVEGDLALQRVAQIIKTAVGEKGIAARYGGKEFAIILPGCDLYRAVHTAEEIKQQIADMNKIPGKSSILKAITLSGGVCVYPYAAGSAKQLVNNTDMAVYNAKRAGKNKILSYSIKDAGQQKEAVGELPPIKSGSYADYAPTIYALTAAIDAKDHYTFSHSQRVAEFAAELGRAIGLNEDHVQLIYEAGLLHDIGKIGIPEHILTKSGRLTAEEYIIMQTHVENSIAIIRHLLSLDYVIPAAISHHERWDGTGYPRGIGGEDIPVAGRCLALADSFEAMVARRIYREPISVEAALEEIERCAGRQFDPELARVFVSLVRSGKIKA